MVKFQKIVNGSAYLKTSADYYLYAPNAKIDYVYGDLVDSGDAQRVL